MKRWLPHFALRRQLKALRKPMDPGFTESLKLRLEKRAEAILPGTTAHFSPNVALLMKKRSLLYTSFLALIAVFTFILFPSHGKLSTEEVIQKASAASDEAAFENKIYHEERLSEHFENGEATVRSLEEWWINPTSGESLWIVRNPDTKELVQASGTTDQGDSYDYPSIPDGEESTWFKTFAGDKFVCVESLNEQGVIAQGVLTLASEDPTVNTVNGSSYSLNELASYASEVEASLGTSSLSGVQNVVRAYYEDQDEVISYETSSEKGKDYYVFTVDSNEESMPTTKEYFNAETFQLEKTRIMYEEETYDQITYLKVEHLDPAAGPSIFNFDSYQMTLTQAISAGAPGFATSEDGCYNPEHELMDEAATAALLNQVDAETLESWKTMAESVLSSSIERNEGTPIDPSALVQSPNIETDLTFVKPTIGRLTALFTATHPAIDMARENEEDTPPDIVATTNGTVTEVNEGTWNGGYGNEVWITHADGFQSHYAHMGEILVSEGEEVTQGQVIGVMGNSGRVYGATGIHLHFELLYNGEKINPIDYISF